MYMYMSIMAPASLIWSIILIIAVGALADDWTIFIPAGNPSGLQDYLCNGSLPSNTTLQLQQGVHVISREGFCSIDVGPMNIRLVGAGVRETTINCTRKWGFEISSVLHVIIEGLTFVNCGGATKAVLNLHSTHSITVRNLSFVNISNIGVLGETLTTVTMSDVYFYRCAEDRACVGASFTSEGNATLIIIKRCSFVDLGYGGSSNYRYDDAAGLQLQGHVVADIRDCSFVGNRGAGLFVIQSNVSISNCSFSGNVANRGAALSASSVRFLNVTGSRFYSNRAYTGAAIWIRKQFESPFSALVVVNNCLFQNNKADIGGGILILDLLSVVVVSASTFMHNSACIGAAIYAGDKHNGYGERSYSVSLIDVEVVENECSPCTNGAKGAVVYYNEIDYLKISGSSIGSKFIGNHPQGAVQGIGANLHLSGMVSFGNNSGENGAAIYLTNDAHLYFHVKCTVNISNNVATGYGGAIYIQGDQSIPTYILTYCAVHFIGPGNYSIHFQGVLCGRCPDGLSVVFGSAECQKCSDMWLLTILLYAVMGALLVTALFLLNITVTSGSLNGLIFYANILVVNGTIFFSQSNLMPLEIIVSLINLDLGFPLCFYNGMDDLAKTGLQFVFPAYLLFITFAIVVTKSDNLSEKELSMFLQL
eukprot:Em0001g1412a